MGKVLAELDIARKNRYVTLASLLGVMGRTPRELFDAIHAEVTRKAGELGRPPSRIRLYIVDAAELLKLPTEEQGQFADNLQTDASLERMGLFGVPVEIQRGPFNNPAERLTDFVVE